MPDQVKEHIEFLWGEMNVNISDTYSAGRYIDMEIANLDQGIFR